MRLIAITSFAAILGACTTTPTSPNVGTLTTNTASTVYTIAQGGVDYTLTDADTFVEITLPSGQTVKKWNTGTAAPAGYALHTIGATSAAGLDNGTYFAGIYVKSPYSGTLSTTGTANLAGAYAFIVNGTNQEGALNLTADFGNGTLASTTSGIIVNGAISGININGTMTVAGETGNLSAGFADLYSGYEVVGAAVGANMAGVFNAN